MNFFEQNNRKWLDIFNKLENDKTLIYLWIRL